MGRKATTDQADERRRGWGEGTIIERPAKDGSVTFLARVWANGKRYTKSHPTRVKAQLCATCSLDGLPRATIGVAAVAAQTGGVSVETALVIATNASWAPSSGRVVQKADCWLNVERNGHTIEAHLYQIEADSGTFQQLQTDHNVLGVFPLSTSTNMFAGQRQTGRPL